MRFFLLFFFFGQFAYAINIINPFYPASLTANWDTTPADGGVLNGAGTWNLDSTSFTYNGGANNSPFCQGCNVVFGGGASTGLAGTVNVTGNQRINNILFEPTPSGTPTYVLSGGALTCVNPSGNCTYTANQNATIGSVIATSTNGFIKEGLGNLTISGNNTFTGTVDINAGTLTFSTPSNNQYRGGQININNGSTMSLVSTGGSDRYDFPTGQIFNFNNVGGGSIITTGAPPLNWVQKGNWIFATNGGARNNIGGVHNLNMNNGAGNITFSVTPGADPISDLDVTIPLANSDRGMYKNGLGTVRFIATITNTGETHVDAGTLSLGDGVKSGNIIPATNKIETKATLIYNTPDIITHSGIIRGSGTFTKLGPGTLALSGTNTYTGNTTVSSGTLSLGDGTTDGNIIPAINLITNNATLTYNTPSTISHSGAISGTGIFIKEGGGTITLNGASTYTGGTTINAGTIICGVAGALGTGTVTVNPPGTFTKGPCTNATAGAGTVN